MKSKQLIINHQSGSITPPLLIITSAFVFVIFALLLVLSLQLDFSHRQVASEQAINIAEAGINYYRWHLAHAPEDYQDGTEEEGSYEHDYLDPQGTNIGKFKLEITPPADGSTIVTIKSIGWSNRFPNVQRTIRSQFGIPSLARYSFLSNASSWYGSGITVHGRLHSNNGIRMDGVNTSLVTSAQETYMCGSETGCHPPQQKPGVWGSGPGGNQGLWQFPVPSIDFNSISFDFAQMKEASQNNGLYLPSSGSGYHIRFFNNGTFQVWRITSTNYIYGYSVPGQGLGEQGQGGCRRQYQLIANETSIGTYNVSEKPIVFAENHLWVEGIVKGRITVVAAGFPVGSSNMNIWIPNNITYAAYDHTNTLGLIAQTDIYYTKNVPNNFRIDAALIAQKGRILRHGYFSWCGGTSEAVKDSLTIYGALIGYDKSYWNFGTAPDSGFRTRTITYDADLLYLPPPYFPTSGEYEFISWTEE